jgi:hypothetical protein
MIGLFRMELGYETPALLGHARRSPFAGWLPHAQGNPRRSSKAAMSTVAELLA